MALFRRQQKRASVLTPEMIQVIAVSSVELTAKNETASQRWGIGAADRWSADLAEGTISFHFPEHSIVGPVEMLGSYSAETGTFLWGWANDSMPDGVKSASKRTREYGESQNLLALTERKLDVPDDTLALDLAGVTVEVAELAGLYRSPSATGFVYLGFSEFHSFQR